MTLHVEVRHRLGDFVLDARFEADGGVTAIFGPSGAGKTTLAQILAGLLRPDDGRVVVGAQVFVDTRRGVFVPPHRRRIGCVFQDGRLFPHMTVTQNLRFGRWFAGRGREAASVDHLVALLGLGPLLGRMPASLSGGEQQRVAIGRALAAAPQVLVLDEPLSGLDSHRRLEVLPYLERLRDDLQIPIVYVTHGTAEIARLASTVVVLAAGRVAFAGPVREAMAQLDLLPLGEGDEAGTLIEGRVAEQDEAFGLTHVAVSGGELVVPRLALARGTRVRTRIRARDVMLATERPAGLSALNVLAARVAAVGPAHGAAVDVRLSCGDDLLLARVTRRSVDALGLVPGREVFAIVKAVTFDPETLGVATVSDEPREAPPAGE